MALDQSHEQLNKWIKAEGGAVGLTEDPAALRRWMLAGPEVSRVIASMKIPFVMKMSTVLLSITSIKPFS